ncbi:hypothetical protein L210DRAFT_871044 [Boletus edulis BED1]|uniref:Uncharacterized protein n=1 Tax=Boletus edulis BED1 TaxID=1328754 RepID=A0AAD4C6E4_BOLED|nr:hypothetical protein L210DRAFT_871044 [Boletus edulis BED1]
MPRPPKNPPAGASSATETTGGKNIKIQWEKNYAYWTDRLIEWCRDNPIKHIKLWGDSTQKANMDGCSKLQMSTHKSVLYAELAEYIFKDDEQFAERWQQDSKPFVAGTERCDKEYAFTLLSIPINNLCKKYTEQVKRLGQTGFGLTIEQLQTSAYSSVIAQIVVDFPWFEDLHGW